jgi:hypothetical protein
MIPHSNTMVYQLFGVHESFDVDKHIKSKPVQTQRTTTPCCIRYSFGSLKNSVSSFKQPYRNLSIPTYRNTAEQTFKQQTVAVFQPDIDSHLPDYTTLWPRRPREQKWPYRPARPIKHTKFGVQQQKGHQATPNYPALLTHNSTPSVSFPE